MTTHTEPSQPVRPYPATIRRVSVGERVLMPVGYSEVACHLQVAGGTMLVELLPGTPAMAQLWHPQEKWDDGSPERSAYVPRPFSFPITPGEAGLYHDDHGWYHHA